MEKHPYRKKYEKNLATYADNIVTLHTTRHPLLSPTFPTMLHIQTFTNNPLEENTYVVHDATKQAVIIDCGALTKQERATIRQYVVDNGLTLCYALLTHGHFDHIFGAQWVYDEFGVRPCIMEADLPLYRKGCLQLREMFGTHLQFEIPEADHTLSDGDVVSFGHHHLRVIATPGHTPGGCCFFSPTEPCVLFSGDSLFCGSIGRTDFPGGSLSMLVESLKKQVLTLPASTIVYPGHGPATTIQHEQESNFYFRNDNT